jgi:hypothetical protein
MLDKAAEYEVSAEIDGAATNTSDKNFFNQNPPPESKNTIQSQLEAMANPRSTKNAVWIPEGSKTLDAIENQALPGLGSVELNLGGRIGKVYAGSTIDTFALPNNQNGVIVSKDKKVVDEVLNTPIDQQESVIGKAIGIPINRPSRGADVGVIVALDSDGNPITEAEYDKDNTSPEEKQNIVSDLKGHIQHTSDGRVIEDSVKNRLIYRNKEKKKEDDLLFMEQVDPAELVNTAVSYLENVKQKVVDSEQVIDPLISNLKNRTLDPKNLQIELNKIEDVTLRENISNEFRSILREEESGQTTITQQNLRFA